MKSFRKPYIGILTALFLLSACAHHQKISPGSTVAVYSPHAAGNGPVLKYSPLFLAYNYDTAFNRIGSPAARVDEQGRERIFVDEEKPVVYYMKHPFSTEKDRYTNLIYRVHFSRIPFSMIPFTISAGKNVGLLVVITLDSQQRPVLVTTVHTCGCYLAIVPTTFLDRNAYPPDWKDAPIRVYGEKLPWQLDYSKTEDPKLLVHLRPGVHRVMDLEIVSESASGGSRRSNVLQSPLRPAEDLQRIPLDKSTTSLYHQKGVLKGHVKGSVKPLESILLSLPSLDLFVGTDKIYGDPRDTGNPFYTSLKPWNRNASDMWDFAEFLAFWGWRL